MSFVSFRSDAASAADMLKKAADPKKVYKVVSHLDADGICSAAIISNALKREKIKFSLSIVKQLSENTIKLLLNEPYERFIFTDLGAGQLGLVIRYLGDKDILILDHHSYDMELKIPPNIRLINPHSHDVDGAKDISGAGVTYLFAESLNPLNKDTAHLAIIGAIGDVQESNSYFSEINESILKTAVEQGSVEITRGLKWFGLETKPLVKLLAYGSEISLPGIYGSESAAVLFLTNIGIEPKKEDWVRFNDLTEDEKSKLISAVVIASQTKDHDKLFARRYLLKKEDPSSPFKDMREFSTMLNACGRLEQATVGVCACLNDTAAKKKAMDIVFEYRRDIVYAMRWYEQHGASVRDDKFVVINAKDEVSPTMIGTLASIITNSDVPQGTIVISMARDADSQTKVSIRIKGESSLDMKEIISQIVSVTGGEGGGHKNAAGGIIPTKTEEEFIKEAEIVLKKICYPND
jgi:single-stranded-DNA-specific exonuclease